MTNNARGLSGPGHATEMLSGSLWMREFTMAWPAHSRIQKRLWRDVRLDYW